MSNNKIYVEKVRSDSDSIWSGKKPLLGHLDMELTERCNNDCIHCYINLPHNDAVARQKEIPTEKLKKILTEAASLGCISVRFTGGEPLLHENFEEIYMFTRKLGVKVLLFTNAVLITESLAELLAEIPPLEKIEITLYGVKKKSYEGVSRISGSFENAMRGINLLKKMRCPSSSRGPFFPQIEMKYKIYINGQRKSSGWTNLHHIQCFLISAVIMIRKRKIE